VLGGKRKEGMVSSRTRTRHAKRQWHEKKISAVPGEKKRGVSGRKGHENQSLGAYHSLEGGGKLNTEGLGAAGDCSKSGEETKLERSRAQ